MKATADYFACLALRDRRASENAAARARMQADPALTAALLANAHHRGLPGIDWPEYFRNVDVNYP